MPDGGIDPTRQERKRRFKRRHAANMIHARGDIPQDIGEYLIEHGFKFDDDSTDPEEWFASLVRAVRETM